jgi:hypothetical protein
MCQLYERGPVVLVLFVDEGSCSGILKDLQALAPSFPGVQFAAVAIKGDRGRLRKLVRAQGLASVSVGIDSDGVLATLYKVASCPQVTFAYPGGAVQSKALLTQPPRATLRARVEELVAGARARGWKEPSKNVFQKDRHVRDASLDTALDRHATACACHQHALHRPATPSLVHERTGRTAYFERRSG